MINETRFVYFMRPVGMDGPIKIGCSTVPKHRLAAISTWSPFPLEIVATVRGGHELEARLHRRFAFAHSHREWFHANPALLNTVEALVRGENIEDVVDFSIDTGSINGRGKSHRDEPEWRKGYRSYRMRVSWAEKKLRKAIDDQDGRWKPPGDVLRILDDWCGNPYRGIDGVRPTAMQFRRLEQYLSNPAEHSVFPSWVRAKEAA